MDREGGACVRAVAYEPRANHKHLARKHVHRTTCASGVAVEDTATDEHRASRHREGAASIDGSIVSKSAFVER